MGKVVSLLILIALIAPVLVIIPDMGVVAVILPIIGILIVVLYGWRSWEITKEELEKRDQFQNKSSLSVLDFGTVLLLYAKFI